MVLDDHEEYSKVFWLFKYVLDANCPENTVSAFHIHRRKEARAKLIKIAHFAASSEFIELCLIFKKKIYQGISLIGPRFSLNS